MSRIVTLTTAGLALALFSEAPVASQSRYTIPPEEGGLIRSMGQPPAWRWYAGFTGGADGSQPDRRFMANAEVGVYRDLMHPVYAILGWNAEAYMGLRGGDESAEAGGRLLLESPTFRLSLGLDYGIRAGLDPILRAKIPVRRGGFPVRGGTVQLNYLPTRDHSWHAGLTIPLGQFWRGRTRPRHARVKIETPDPQRPAPTGTHEVRMALINAREAARWITRLTVPYFEQGGVDEEDALQSFEASLRELEDHMASTGDRYPNGRTRDEEIRVFHAEIERAFSMAITDSVLAVGEIDGVGLALTAAARRILLDELILPYNRLLGRSKINDTSRNLGRVAEAVFASRVADDPSIPVDRKPAVQYVFQQLLEIAEIERANLAEEWNDDRLGWIPLQLGLIPEEHDTQAELNELIERAVGRPWTEGNRFWYVRNAQFLWETGYTVRRARDYHVLWIHDVAALNAAGEPDFVTHFGMVNFYFEALTRAVRAYDERGKLPIFLIFNDQLFYENKASHLWFDILEDPMNASYGFLEGFEDHAAALDTVQRALRDAVAGSARLQEEAARFGGEWLLNRVKVHVSVTNPADPNYATNQFLPFAGWPDDALRDHRKIAFYDVSEEDPYSGMGLYSGMGIGEHYAGGTWEDRSVMIQGPALLELKRAAYRLMLEQGFEPEEIPEQLRPRQLASDYEDRVREEMLTSPFRGRGMELHNATGHGQKDLNVAKAVLYTLMPPGSVIILPDSLWNGSFWAALLVGNCLSGGRVFIIAPSAENAPGIDNALAMSRTHELFARLVVVRDQLGDRIRAEGGMLEAGFYRVDAEVSDLPASVELVLEGRARTPWLEEMLPFHPRLLALLRIAGERFEDFEVDYLFEDAESRKPQLHLKTSYFATPEAWEPLLSLPWMMEVFELYGAQQEILETNRRVYTDVRLVYEPLEAAIDAAVVPWLENLPPETRARFGLYLMTGSVNQAYRSLFMDGEAVYLATGLDAFEGIFDFVYLMTTAVWMTSLEELETYLPAQSEFKFKLARLLRRGI
ncbi:MAG: hypothetical protein OEU54_04100 [Gemmatimonadota bacterium]|nr:hypothetical protein [Gemmatimonadota bacterium]